MSKVVVSLGSNKGNRFKNLIASLKYLKSHPEISIEMVSSVYETAPVCDVDQPFFYNSVVLIKTKLSPEELLFELQGIE